MPYLRVECLSCRIIWNYYDVIDNSMVTTNVVYQEGTCPKCGFLRLPESYKRRIDDTAKPRQC